MLPRSYDSQPSWLIAQALEGVGGRSQCAGISATGGAHRGCGGRVEDPRNRTGCRPVLDPRDVSRTGRVGVTNP